MKQFELDRLSPLNLGRYPTPVRRARALETGASELWVKDDGVSNPLYGGNKVRKLELILAHALRKNSRRILTAGSAASHHVLATALFAKQVGIPVAAVLCPQPWTPHAEATFRATLATGIETFVVKSMAAVPLGLARARRAGDYFVPPGGTSDLGTLAYLHATRELLEQIRRGELPEPDVIVAALGSGGTVAGLLAGVQRIGLKPKIVGVDIATNKTLGRAIALGFARRATGLDRGDAGLIRLARGLEVDGTARGPGYGYPTESGTRATAEAAGIGLELDPTYTSKTFARALEIVRAPGKAQVVLYWHTLSSAPLDPLCRGAPEPIEGLLFPIEAKNKPSRKK